MVALAAAAEVAAVAAAGKHRPAAAARRAKQRWVIGASVLLCAVVALGGAWLLSQQSRAQVASYTALHDKLTVRVEPAADGIALNAAVTETLTVAFAPGNTGTVIERAYRAYRPPMPQASGITVHDEAGHTVPVRLRQHNQGNSRSGSSEQHATMLIGDQQATRPLSGQHTYTITYNVTNIIGTMTGSASYGQLDYSLPLPRPRVATRQLVADIIFPEQVLTEASIPQNTLVCNRFRTQGEGVLGPCQTATAKAGTIHIEHTNLAADEFIRLGAQIPRSHAGVQAYQNAAWRRWLVSPLGVLSIALVIIAALVIYARRGGAGKGTRRRSGRARR